jgi:hypothetical protein
MTKSKNILVRPDLEAVYKQGQRIFELITLLAFIGALSFFCWLLTFKIMGSTLDVQLVRYFLGPVGLIYSSLLIYSYFCLIFSSNPTLKLTQLSLRYSDWLFDVEIPWSHILASELTSHVVGGIGSQYLVVAYGKSDNHQLLVIDLGSADNKFEIQSEMRYRLRSKNSSLVNRYRFGTAHFLRLRLYINRLTKGKVVAQLHEFPSSEVAQQSLESQSNDSETYLEEFQAIVLEHLKTNVDEATWQQFRNHAIAGMIEEPIEGSETWTREQLVELGVQVEGGSVKEILNAFAKDTFVIGSIRECPVYFVIGSGIYVWALKDETDDALELWLTCPAYPPGW